MVTCFTLETLAQVMSQEGHERVLTVSHLP